jgi:hypothetical protein
MNNITECTVPMCIQRTARSCAKLAVDASAYAERLPSKPLQTSEAPKRKEGGGGDCKGRALGCRWGGRKHQSSEELLHDPGPKHPESLLHVYGMQPCVTAADGTFHTADLKNCWGGAHNCQLVMQKTITAQNLGISGLIQGQPQRRV